MTRMPDYAVRATWPDLLPEDREEALLDLVPGTVVAHPAEGGTEVSVPTTASNLLEVVDGLRGLMVSVWAIAGSDPASVAVEPLED